MTIEGSLHLVWLNKGHQVEPKYMVGFADNRSGGAMNSRTFIGEPALRSFLISAVHVHSPNVNAAISEINEKGVADLHVVLAEDELKGLSLM
jgi:hypothetical protein